VLQAKARLNYCFLFKITLLWQLRFISKSEKEPCYVLSLAALLFTLRCGSAIQGANEDGEMQQGVGMVDSGGVGVGICSGDVGCV
jgi:hypothetical protein